MKRISLQLGLVIGVVVIYSAVGMVAWADVQHRATDPAIDTSNLPTGDHQ